MSSLTIKDLAIALIEPSPIQARIIEGHLKSMDVNKVQHFQNGQDMLAALNNIPPDLIISAMYLPDMTATHLVQTIRSDESLEDIPFMLISSETSFASLDPIRQAGIVAILPKPFDPVDLKRALYSTIELVAPDENALAELPLEDLKVLVVDDSTLARKHIMRVLGQLGIENMQQAENGKMAVGCIENNYFDLIVTDYNMPEMDGEALTRYIRSQSSQRAIPVLMVTSEENESRLSAVQQAGVSGICDKPFEPMSVKQMIRNLLIQD